MNSYFDSLSNVFLPEYLQLQNDFKGDINQDGYALFFPQIGFQYPQRKNSGLLWIGRATNGWGNDVKKDTINKEYVQSQFEESIMNDYIECYWSKQNENKYKFKRSAFWRIIAGVSSRLYEQGYWSNYIAYSNLYKIAPSCGNNPSSRVKKAQCNACNRILQLEIDMLSPKAVILLTGQSWCRGFFLEDIIKTNPVAYSKLGNYTVFKWICNGINFIITEHPMRKPEQEHIHSILSLLKND